MRAAIWCRDRGITLTVAVREESSNKQRRNACGMKTRRSWTEETLLLNTESMTILPSPPHPSISVANGTRSMTTLPLLQLGVGILSCCIGREERKSENSSLPVERMNTHALLQLGVGHLEMLQWARTASCPWDEDTCFAAAWGGAP